MRQFGAAVVQKLQLGARGAAEGALLAADDGLAIRWRGAEGQGHMPDPSGDCEVDRAADGVDDLFCENGFAPALETMTESAGMSGSGRGQVVQRFWAIRRF